MNKLTRNESITTRLTEANNSSLVRDFNEWIEEQLSAEGMENLLGQMEDGDMMDKVEDFMMKVVKKTKNDFKKAASK
jgi:hypothetical protein